MRSPPCFPDAQVQTCIVHLIRNSLDFVSYKDGRSVAGALKEVYKAADADSGAAALETFAESDWGRKYPAIAMSWRRHWQAVFPFFAFLDDVYTTNAIEALTTLTDIDPLDLVLRRNAAYRGQCGVEGEFVKNGAKLVHGSGWIV
jgi:transposase-like protein